MTLLFNVNGSDAIEDQKLIGGNPTGIVNLNNVRYNWVPKLYKTMVSDFWIPEKVSMQEDKVSIKNLTDKEDQAVRNTLSFLIFLDSMQVNNLPNIADHLTDPSVKFLINIQQFQEVIHTQSYQYGLEALYPSVEREEIYNLWRGNELLLKRNKFIADQYQEFIDKPSEESFKKVLVANYCLEGIYFYSGFNYFEQLASREKLTQFAKIIKYIKTDENNHLKLFEHILKELLDFSVDSQWVSESIVEAGNQEIEWAKEIYGEGILGISKKSSENFVHFLVDKRLKALGLSPVYNVKENPYKHLEAGKRENFFESSAVTEYSKSEAVGGWDDF
jgi:ribonucleoside-diphosphate reductase beta chain